jgi:F-type H+-transporting ATPase subunit a
MSGEGLGSPVWLHFAGIAVGEPIVVSFILTVLLTATSYWVGRRLTAGRGRMQVAAEAAVSLMTGAVAEVVPAADVPRVLPFVGTLWLFILAANLVGLVPGLSSPFHLVSELTRTLALAVRLFGNMMSLEMAALLVLLVAGFLVPVPLLVLHVIEALVQAYIFGTLALIYIGSALEARGPVEQPAAAAPDSSSNAEKAP